MLSVEAPQIYNLFYKHLSFIEFALGHFLASHWKVTERACKRLSHSIKEQKILIDNTTTAGYHFRYFLFNKNEILETTKSFQSKFLRPL